MSWIEVTSDEDITKCITLIELNIGGITPVGGYPRTLEEIKAVNSRKIIRWFAYFDPDPMIVLAFSYSNSIDKWWIFTTHMADDTYKTTKFKKYREFMDEVKKDLFALKSHIHPTQQVCVDPKILASYQDNEVIKSWDAVNVDIIDDGDKYIYKVRV